MLRARWPDPGVDGGRGVRDRRGARLQVLQQRDLLGFVDGTSQALSELRLAGVDGASVLSTPGGDFDLQLGTDVCIGYLSHDADTVQLYLQETLTFLNYTAEAAVALSA